MQNGDGINQNAGRDMRLLILISPISYPINQDGHMEYFEDAGENQANTIEDEDRLSGCFMVVPLGNTVVQVEYLKQWRNEKRRAMHSYHTQSIKNLVGARWTI